MFSGPSKVAFLSYIPVDEDFVIKTDDSSLALESDLGPIRAKFKGRFEWDADSNEMHFAFNRAQVCSRHHTWRCIQQKLADSSQPCTSSHIVRVRLKMKLGTNPSCSFT